MDVYERDSGISFVLIECMLNENNYLNKFPYRTKSEYIDSNSFGGRYATVTVGKDTIEYKIEGPPYILNFDNEKLQSIRREWYIP